MIVGFSIPIKEYPIEKQEGTEEMQEERVIIDTDYLPYSTYPNTVAKTTNYYWVCEENKLYRGSSPII